MLRTSFLAAAAVVVVAGLSLVVAAADPPAKKRSIVMEKKLEYAQDLLQALMTEDYEQAERSINLMKTFTRLEEMYRGKRPEYRAQLTKFQKSVGDMTNRLDAKDYDGLNDAYVGMMQSCIRCHRELKKE